MSLTLTSRRDRGVTVVKPAGELDAASAVHLRMLVLDLLAQRRTVVIVDLAKVSFIDGVGCRTLVDARQRLSARGGELRLARPTAAVARMLRTTGLGRVLPPHETIAAAVRAIEQAEAFSR